MQIIIPSDFILYPLNLIDAYIDTDKDYQGARVYIHKYILKV